MSTQLQLEANRENAKASTGPRTESGKAASSKNAIKHGLTAKGFVVDDDQIAEFQILRDGLRLSLCPTGPLQEILFDRILRATWNLRRCALAESRYFLELGCDPLDNPDSLKHVLNIQRYARQNESTLNKAMKELAAIQTEMKFREAVASPVDEAETCQTMKVVAMLWRHKPNEPKLPSDETNPIRQAAPSGLVVDQSSAQNTR